VRKYTATQIAYRVAYLVATQITDSLPDTHAPEPHW
jgi:hypothetical protein